MYKLIAIISTLVRQFVIPNPFEVLEGMTIPVGNAFILLSPELLNWMIEPIVHSITFAIVGLYYKKYSAPMVGSILYLFFYSIHVFLLWVISMVKFSPFIVAIVFLLYFSFHFGLKCIIKQVF